MLQAKDAQGNDVEGTPEDDIFRIPPEVTKKVLISELDMLPAVTRKVLITELD